ncbi:MAG TPA: WYL domain-containing protein [Spirochaetota bacterium]|nr:WYL domain-containing protein [Spirochaetota bacterium]
MFLKINTNINILQRCLHILGFLQNKEGSRKWNARTLTDELWKDTSLFGDYASSRDSSPESAVIAKNARTFLKSTGLITMGQGTSEWRMNKMTRAVLTELTFNHSIFTAEDFHRTKAVKSLVKRSPDTCLWIFSAIHFARVEKRKIRFTYKRTYQKDSGQHVVNPYFIILTNYNFYLFGKSSNDEIKYFLLSKVKDLEILNEKFKEKIPSPDTIMNKSISGAFIGGYGIAPVKDKVYNVTIHFKKRILSKIEDLLSSLDNCTITEKAEHCEAVFQIYDDIELCKQLFYFGKDIEIIGPEELRKTMKEMLENSMKVYIKTER